MAKEHILGRQIARCPFKVGDVVLVKGKKERRGIVLNLESSVSQVAWNKNGTQPFFVAVDFVTTKMLPNGGLEYAHDIHNFPIKMLKAVRK